MRRASALTPILPILLALNVSVRSETKLPPPAKLKVDYDRDIKPILSANCFACHGQKQAQSGLRLDLRQNAMRGGDYGAVIAPGKSAESKLILRLAGSDAGLQMPPAGPLPEGDISVLRAWIDQGADMPGRAMNSSAEESKPTDPKVQSFLDIIHRQEATGFRKALETDPSLAKAADAAGSTMLMHATYAGTIEMMRFLLEAGADPNAHNNRNATALHWGVTDAAKLKLLLSKNASVEAKAVDGRTVLHVAAALPAGAPVVKLLLDAGANPNARTLVGTTPLFSAVSASFESTQLLLAKGADPKAKSATGGTALMAAAFESPKTAALLIARGADVNATTKRGVTALANAANGGNLETARLLIEKEANVNAADYRGYTSLMHAAYRDNASPELIRLLLDHGADISATGEGETAVSLAAKRGETETTRLLRAAEKTGRPSAAAR
jgi:ankyrin repeat protein